MEFSPSLISHQASVDVKQYLLTYSECWRRELSTTPTDSVAAKTVGHSVLICRWLLQTLGQSEV